MIFFITAVYLLLHSSHAAPPFTPSGTAIPPVSDVVPFVAQPSIQQCICVPQRSALDILWSCFATVFACAWVSVHPNMPRKGESSLKVTVRRLELMAWTIIVPELIITWAMRQWLGARQLAKQYKEYNWTKTHGHFLQMGGFILLDSENNWEQVLMPGHLAGLYHHGDIDIPEIPEGEIKERSRGDLFSKTLVLGQTTWFIVQCVTRSIQGLVITQLELVTLALAFLHGFMYFLWLNKPLAAQYPIPIRRRVTRRIWPEVEDPPALGE
ncbi:hypothetical protein CPC08DRAFT_785148 [Agrocybe pediades]|nr:hypothetical protein CPC08DRAFT_785148 [Agrocybe pediades]